MTLLSVAQLTYNISINQITGTISFFINYEYNTNLFQELKKAIILTEQVNITVQEMWKMHSKFKRDIEFLLHYSVFYHNKHHTEASMLKERDKVYLLWKNIETTRSSRKLDHIKIKSFKIIRNIKNVSFELKLLKSMQWKHLVFHVSLLKPASDSMSLLDKVLDNYLIKQEDWYEVEKILKNKKIKEQQCYLVKWKHYSSSENIWELVTNLDKCSSIMKCYYWQIDSLVKKRIR